MSKATPHSSSGGDFKKQARVKYINEKDANVYEIASKAKSEFLPDNVITWKTTISSTPSKKKSASFQLDINRIAREESTYRLNKKLKGIKEISISSTND